MIDKIESAERDIIVRIQRIRNDASDRLLLAIAELLCRQYGASSTRARIEARDNVRECQQLLIEIVPHLDAPPPSGGVKDVS